MVIQGSSDIHSQKNHLNFLYYRAFSVSWLPKYIANEACIGQCASCTVHGGPCVTFRPAIFQEMWLINVACLHVQHNVVIWEGLKSVY